MKKTLFLTMAGALVLAGCGGADTSSDREAAGSESGGTEVVVKAFQYQPDPIEVEPGTTITWLNEDNIDHTVTSGIQRDQGVPGVEEDVGSQPDGTFDGDLPMKGASFSFTFEEAGTFAYFCEIHAGMTGVVEVS